MWRSPAVKTPFGKAENFRYKITGQGIEHLQELEDRGVKAEIVPPKEIQSRLVETYDRIKSDMEEMRQSLETSQKALDEEMGAMRKQIADHDNVIRTYFVRVIETFGVFVGIFAVVVVAMISSINAAASAASDKIVFAIVILVAIPIILVTVIVTLLFAIRELVLKMPKTK